MKKFVVQGGFGFGKLGSGAAGVDEVLQKRTVQMTPVKFRPLPFKLRTAARGWSRASWPSSSSIVSRQTASITATQEAEDMRTADTSGFDESQEDVM